MRADEAELIKSKIRELQTYTVIDVVSARLDENAILYWSLEPFKHKKHISDKYIREFENYLVMAYEHCIITLFL